MRSIADVRIADCSVESHADLVSGGEPAGRPWLPLPFCGGFARRLRVLSRLLRSSSAPTRPYSRGRGGIERGVDVFVGELHFVAGPLGDRRLEPLARCSPRTGRTTPRPGGGARPDRWRRAAGMAKSGLKWAPRHSSRCRAPFRIVWASGNMSSRALVKTTFWFVQLPVSESEHFLARSARSLDLAEGLLRAGRCGARRWRPWSSRRPVPGGSGTDSRRRRTRLQQRVVPRLVLLARAASNSDDGSSAAGLLLRP